MKAARGLREANSQWKSECDGFLRGQIHSEGASLWLAGGVQSAGVAYVDKTWCSCLALNCRGHLQQCLFNLVLQAHSSLMFFVSW